MTKPSLADLEHLEEIYRAAIESLSDIIWTDEFPSYPEPIVHLMCYILGSVWVYRGYDVKNAIFFGEGSCRTLEEIQCTLTALARAEGIAIGSWKQSLESDRMSPLISQARSLLDSTSATTSVPTEPPAISETKTSQPPRRSALAHE